MKEEWRFWEYGQLMLDQGDIDSLDEWSTDKEMVGQICDRIFDYLWIFNNKIRLIDRLFDEFTYHDDFTEEGYKEYKDKYGECSRRKKDCVLNFESFEELFEYFLKKLKRMGKGYEEERKWIRERLKKATKYEQQFIEKINEAKQYCKGDLELDLFDDDTYGYSWYAMDYREEWEAAISINNKKYDEPLITEADAQKYNIDVKKCCDLCHIYYVG